MVTGLTVHADVLAAAAVSHFTTAADLAEELAQRFRLDYRTAYRVVGRAVAATLTAGGGELTTATVIAAAREITGQDIPVTAGLLDAVTDPASVVAARQAPGSASPARVRQHARRVHRRAGAARRWNADRRARNTQAEAGLIAAVTALARSPGSSSGSSSRTRWLARPGAPARPGLPSSRRARPAGSARRRDR